jgi:hypothetical protein
MRPDEHRTPDGHWRIPKAADRLCLPLSVVEDLVREGAVEVLVLWNGFTAITPNGFRMLQLLAGDARRAAENREEQPTQRPGVCPRLPFVRRAQ